MLKSVNTKLKKAYRIRNIGIISDILGITARRWNWKNSFSQKEYVDELCEKFD